MTKEQDTPASATVTPDHVSPLPWHVRFERDTFYVMTARDYYVARCHDSPGDLDEHGNDQFSDKANVRYIVRACNSYPALLASVKEMRDAMAAMMRVIAMHPSGIAEEFGREIERVGVPKGFGVRAQHAIKQAEATHGA